MKTHVVLAVSRRRLTVAALLSLASFAASINLVFAALVRMGDEFGVRPELLASITSVYFVAFFIVSSHPDSSQTAGVSGRPCCSAT